VNSNSDCGGPNGSSGSLVDRRTGEVAGRQAFVPESASRPPSETAGRTSVAECVAHRGMRSTTPIRLRCSHLSFNHQNRLSEFCIQVSDSRRSTVQWSAGPPPHLVAVTTCADIGASLSSHGASAAVTASRARSTADESRPSISARKGEPSTRPFAALGALTRVVQLDRLQLDPREAGGET
jgi:hypothetical protein